MIYDGRKIALWINWSVDHRVQWHRLIGYVVWYFMITTSSISMHILTPCGKKSFAYEFGSLASCVLLLFFVLREWKDVPKQAHLSSLHISVDHGIEHFNISVSFTILLDTDKLLFHAVYLWPSSKIDKPFPVWNRFMWFFVCLLLLLLLRDCNNNIV